MEANDPVRSGRIHRRSRVLVLVRWHNRREERAAAEICDVSAQGLFLVPEGPLPDEVKAGDLVWVVVPVADGGEETLTGTVRWRGFHPSHKNLGCGIQLDPASIEIIQRLFPIVQEP